MPSFAAAPRGPAMRPCDSLSVSRADLWAGGFARHPGDGLTRPEPIWYYSATHTELSMPDEMGTFRVDVEIENPARPGQRRLVRSALVDTGAELSWIPA